MEAGLQQVAAWLQQHFRCNRVNLMTASALQNCKLPLLQENGIESGKELWKLHKFGKRLYSNGWESD